MYEYEVQERFRALNLFENTLFVQIILGIRIFLIVTIKFKSCILKL